VDAVQLPAERYLEHAADDEQDPARLPITARNTTLLVRDPRLEPSDQGERAEQEDVDPEISPERRRVASS
jgi:hypothetical protein